MSSLVEALGDRAVGTVEEVTADKIVVLLDPSAPKATALISGAPSGFPRINGYLMVPNEVGATVGWITAVRIQRSSYPKRKGMQDFGLIDLPFPARLVTLTPLGTLRDRRGDGSSLAFEVHRGVDVFPSVGDPVLVPTPDQLSAIVEGDYVDGRGRIHLGHCPTAASAPVYVDPDKLFGRHLAVLGNTGAGKSCTVAGLIRWSLQAAGRTEQGSASSASPNARFIVLDPNGEYAQAFGDLNVRLFQVEPKDAEARRLRVPAWLWNGEEWAAFTGASPGVQRPILFEALGHLRSGDGMPDSFENRTRRMTQRYRIRLKGILQSGDHQGAGVREGTAATLSNAQRDFEDLATNAGGDSDLATKLQAVADRASAVESAARSNVDQQGKQWHNDFAEVDIEDVLKRLDDVAEHSGALDHGSPVGEDVPLCFPVEELPDFVDAIASSSTGRDLAQFVESLNMRIRGLLGREALAKILHPEDSAAIKLEDWLAEYIGADQAATGQVTVLDLSLVPSEVIHIVVAVLARMILEALQRYRHMNGTDLPTVLVLDEAHTFVHRNLTADGAPPAGRTCSRIFERIAREGRKFGLGLVVASQRPAEISPTVLSQCNTFVLHRIVNDRDQDLVRRLVPDGLGALLRELPSLPSRRAILLGWAVPAPVLVEVNELADGERPHSPDPAFWDVWTGNSERSIDWSSVVRDWTGGDGAADEIGDGDQEDFEDDELDWDEDGDEPF